MNRNKLKTYAPQARRDFIQAVTDRAAQYGLSAKKIEPMTEQGDVAIIGGRPFPKAVGEKRKKLESRIQKLGFGQTMDSMAYTWFNRLVAIRFMELHGYLEHGYRVLSHPDGRSQPEILEHAQHVDLPGLDKQRVISLKLEGTKEEELYRLLLVGQCNALHKALPFLFEAIDDETELLLPDHLLHSDSLIRKLASEIPEEDWQEVEIIGWLYQFYVVEEKKRIDDYSKSKPVIAEDIPAKTQLFTPNWIVKYLVQNSLGRQWVATYSNSPLKGQMKYFIEPAEQTPEVQAKLAELTPTSLNPEELTLIDPACGSGHILTEAYDLLQRIYQEQGYRAKDIPRLILEKNLFGLEIDDRAAQLAAFALMMKARADDRSIFERGAQPHVLAIRESKSLDAKEITEALNQPLLKEEPPPSGELFEEIADARSPLFSKKTMGVKGAVSQADVAHLISLFEHGKTFGSLIHVPEKLAEKLPTLAERVEAVIAHGGMFEKAAACLLSPLIEQATLLSRRYQAVVANPPYLGSKALPLTFKDFAANTFPDTKSDTFAMFIERGFDFIVPQGANAMVTMQSWMFLSSFESLRSRILRSHTTYSLTHMANNVMGIAFGTAATIWLRSHVPHFRASFGFVSTDDLGSDGSPKELPVRNARQRSIQPDAFRNLPGQVFSYWASEAVSTYFANNRPLNAIGDTRQGMATTDNERFLRYWHEVQYSKVAFGCKSTDEAKKSSCKWLPYNKGGEFRKWYGNADYVINWLNDGQEIVQLVTERYGSPSKRITSKDRFFQPCISWSKVSSGDLALRHFPAGFIFDVAGCSIFFSSEKMMYFCLAMLNSNVARFNVKILSPTINYEAGHLALVPLPPPSDALESDLSALARQSVRDAKKDWDSHEVSWDFERNPLLSDEHYSSTCSSTWERWRDCCAKTRNEQHLREERINTLLCGAYGITNEVSTTTPDDEITLYRPCREEDAKRLISYSLGCMMGRYSLDEPGLIYAHGGNQGFNPSKYRKFPADDDGIIPFTEFNWFPDDASSRFEKFIATAWPAEALEENLKFVAESLGSKTGETPRDTLRRYLANDFYKHHLAKAMYKNRPIYWLFSSGKQRGFQALVYLHRYNDGTLARMRTEYVIPLLGKMTARISHLTDDSAAATSSQHKKRLETEKATITKQLAEVQAFDEQLRHFADQRIKLDLDDGVKVNYGKFGDLLAEVKAVCGKSEEAD